MKNKLRSAFNTRQYMLSDDFELYYYNDMGMETMPMHAHDYYEFYMFVEGNVSIETENKKTQDSVSETTIAKLLPGDLVLIPPGIRHHAVIHDSQVPYRRFVFWISKEYCNKLMSDSMDYVYIFQQAEAFRKYIYHMPPVSFHTVESRILRLLEEINSDRYGKGAAIHICVCDIVLTMNRLIYDENSKPAGNDEATLFQAILSYIEAHVEENMSLDELAAEFYVSKFYISHLFKDSLGIAPHQYILKKRLSLCRDAIVSGQSISATYERFGFRDYSSFFKAFKKEYGYSPKEYQNLYLIVK